MLTKEQLVEVTAQRGRLKEPVPMEQTLLEMELISQPQLVSLLKARTQYVENQRKKAGEAATPAGPRADWNQVEIIFMPGGYTPARKKPVAKRAASARP